MDESLEALINTVQQVVNIDPVSLARTETLGQALDFTPAVPIIQRTLELFKSIPPEAIIDLPDTVRRSIKSEADNNLATIARMQGFNPATSGNASQERNELISEAGSRYEQAFAALAPVGGFLSGRRADLSRLEHEAAQTVANAEAQILGFVNDLRQTRDDAKSALSEVRSVAAEAGVATQAPYFGDEATRHENAAADWQKYTVLTAIGLGVFAAATVAWAFYWTPASNIQAVQIGLGKLLVFSTIATMLFLCSKTLMAHRHNAIVNKHRQNALLTFKVLADAGLSERARDIVLTHASGCIYSPQESGFGKSAPGGAGQSVVEVLPQLLQPSQAAG
jgi:hypothetical protein